MIKERITLQHENIILELSDRDMRIHIEDITSIIECHMADSIHHGDEEFHILIMASLAIFCLIGPFVAGVGAVLRDLRQQRPDLPVSKASLRNIPWHMRHRGWLGLRIYPVAGLGLYPLAGLQRLIDPQAQRAGGDG